MIVTEGNAATSNIEQRHGFTIKASAKAFKLLSSNLYSDKPLAIVREIGCNALDSHQMAGKVDVPFKIVLPSDMHPFFEVIDYGVGLSDDQVKNVFTTFFESTKTDSNDQIGAMGLGSKSPFAYTDAYEVFARQNGVQNQYTCFLNQSGAPEIFLIEQTIDPTLEDGVTIKVPVKKNDYHLFRNAAQTAYKFFPVKPVVGASTINWHWDAPIYEFEGTNFKTVTNSRTIFALMGPVAYPIDMNQLKGVDPFISQYNARTGRGFVIQYRIGELDVNAGREGLSYDPRTIAQLIKGMKNIRAEMAKELQDGMGNCKTLYEAIAYSSKADSHNMFKLEFNGKQIATTINYSYRTSDGVDLFQVRKRHYTWLEKLQTVRADSVVISPSVGHTIVLVDDRKHYLKKIRFADSTENISNSFFIINPDVTVVGKDQFKEVIKRLDEDGTPWKYMSDLKYTFPEKVKATIDPNAAKRAKVTYSGFYHFRGPFNRPIAVRDYVNLNDGELEDPRIYIRWGTTEKRLTINGYKFRPDELSSVIWDMIKSAAANAGMEIALVTDKVADKIPTNWIDVSTLLKKEIKQCMTKKSFRDIYGNWVMTGVEMQKVTYETIMADPKINKLFKEYFDPMRKIQFGSQLDYTTEQFIRNTFSMSTDVTVADDNLKSFKNAFFNNSLFEKISGRYYNNWPDKDFRESLVMFSAMVSHGIIDETELRGFLK